ncbi:CBS domain containing membrane protein [Thermobaculum terrenum ATCC BAA-798]|uniref:CBS domain containing membrane protein n=2 Tax=Thermobaculum TaxID=262406 RepID=D1CD53_THET1|nr:CBS domain containing membrane protein [Thermobaculum terrenum ATCC BAA-798]
MLARDIMTTPVVTVTADMSIRDLAKILTEKGISGAPVVDDSGRVVGIVSEADVIAKNGFTVADVMQSQVISASEDTPVEVICSLMTNNKINRVPVLSGDRLVGIVTRADIVRAIAKGYIEAGIQADKTIQSA